MTNFFLDFELLYQELIRSFLLARSLSFNPVVKDLVREQTFSSSFQKLERRYTKFSSNYITVTLVDKNDFSLNLHAK